MLGVDRKDLARLDQPLHQRPTDDQRLLVGQRERAARFERDEGGGQPERAGDAVEHHVARPSGDLRDPLVAGEHDRPGAECGQRLLQCGHGRGVGHRHGLDPELRGLARQQFDLAATGRQPGDLEAAGVGGDDVEGLGADRTGGAEHDHGAEGLFMHVSIVPAVRRTRARGTPDPRNPLLM